MSKAFFALLLSWVVLIIVTGCGALPATTTPIPVPTVTPFAIQPPLSVAEQRAEGVALEFVQAVLLGRDREARSLLAPIYTPPDAHLVRVLGIMGNPDLYSLVADRRVPNGVVFRLLLYYPDGIRIGYITLEQSDSGWFITRLDPPA